MPPRIDLAAVAAARQYNRASAELHKGARAIEQTASQYGRASTESLAGRLAEVLHAATGSANAALQGYDNVLIATTASQGLPNAPADLVVYDGPRVEAWAQVKVYKGARETARALADPKYDGMQRVVPEDQLPGVQEHSRRRIGHTSRSYAETTLNASDRVRYDTVESRPMSREVTLKAARDPQAAASDIRWEARFLTVAGPTGYGALSEGIASACAVAPALRRGEMSLSDAVQLIVGDAASGAANGAALGVSTLAMQSVLRAVGATALAAGDLPPATATVLLNIMGDVNAYHAGQLTPYELRTRMQRHVAAGAIGLIGMRLGAALGTAIRPGTGTILGTMGGWYVAKLLFERLTQNPELALAEVSSASDAHLLLPAADATEQLWDSGYEPISESADGLMPAVSGTPLFRL